MTRAAAKAGAHVRVLDELGRTEDAIAAGEKYLAPRQRARASATSPATSACRSPSCNAKSRRKEPAVALAERAIAQFSAST